MNFLSSSLLLWSIVGGHGHSSTKNRVCFSGRIRLRCIGRVRIDKDRDEEIETVSFFTHTISDLSSFLPQVEKRGVTALENDNVSDHICRVTDSTPCRCKSNNSLIFLSLNHQVRSLSFSSSGSLVSSASFLSPSLPLLLSRTAPSLAAWASLPMACAACSLSRRSPYAAASSTTCAAATAACSAQTPLPVCWRAAAAAAGCATAGLARRSGSGHGERRGGGEDETIGGSVHCLSSLSLFLSPL